jgi:putative membrane protein
LLDNYKNVTVAALVGFMLGSLRLIWTRAVDGVDVVSESGSLDGGQIVLVAILLVAGFVLVSLIDHLQDKDNPIFALFWKPAIVPTDE